MAVAASLFPGIPVPVPQPRLRSIVYIDRMASTHEIERWYRDFAPGLYAYLGRFVADGDRRREVVQETFVRALVSERDLSVERNVRPWLFSVARNLAIDGLRRSAVISFVSTNDDPAAADDGPHGQLASRDATEGVRRALGKLSSRDREIVHLVYYEELPLREVARVMALPVGTVKYRLHVSRRRLGEAIGEDLRDGT